MSSPRPSSARRVLIYRDLLLPFSETFILNQANAMSAYGPVFVGRRRVQGIDLDGHDVAVAATGGWGRGIRELRHALGSPPADLLASLAALKPALLHAHFGPDALSALALQRRLGVPLIATFHGYDATQQTTLRQGPEMWLYGRRRPTLAARSARILAVSDHIRTRLIGLGFPSRLVQTHYIGVDLEQFSPAPLAERESVVLAVGRFVEKKGFEFLIDAIGEVQRQVPNTELILIGSGPLEAQLRRRAAARLDSHRIFGPCGQDVIRGWMQRARVLAVPSVTSRSGDTEGLPIALLEALASGLPVVASHHAGIPEAVDDGSSGYLVAERDVPTLAARIADLLGDDAMWQRFSAASRRVVEQKFDLAAQTRRLEAIYDEVAS
jgi:colanic acid/amylovoran biosynthesis glycosyltransferase